MLPLYILKMTKFEEQLSHIIISLLMMCGVIGVILILIVLILIIIGIVRNNRKGGK